MIHTHHPAQMLVLIGPARALGLVKMKAAGLQCSNSKHFCQILNSCEYFTMLCSTAYGCSGRSILQSENATLPLLINGSGSSVWVEIDRLSRSSESSSLSSIWPDSAPLNDGITRVKRDAKNPPEIANTMF